MLDVIEVVLIQTFEEHLHVAEGRIPAQGWFTWSPLENCFHLEFWAILNDFHVSLLNHLLAALLGSLNFKLLFLRRHLKVINYALLNYILPLLYIHRCQNPPSQIMTEYIFCLGGLRLLRKSSCVRLPDNWVSPSSELRSLLGLHILRKRLPPSSYLHELLLVVFFLMKIYSLNLPDAVELDVCSRHVFRFFLKDLFTKI